MQLITFVSLASAMISTASASPPERNAPQLNKECNKNQPYARVINRCDYPVYLWSVFKGNGCPTSEMVTLNKGETYSENYADPFGGDVGVSIKISKTQSCKPNDIVQLEYFLEKKKELYNFNYLDVSYVDCLNNDCPTKNEGYYLQSGNQTGRAASSAGNTWCPILACNDPVSCAKMSYILPDDVQTKTCFLDANMDFYMCGGEAPTEDYDSAPGSSEQPASTSTQDSYSENYKVDAAAVTNAPEIKDPENGHKTKTQVEIVYVTAYEYVNAKRHVHGHARRHQPFNA